MNIIGSLINNYYSVTYDLRRGKDKKRKRSRQSNDFGRCECMEGFKPLEADKNTGVVSGCINQDSFSDIMQQEVSSFIR